MPLYEYRCTKCGHHIEVLQKFSDRPRRRCGKCSGKLEKLISRTSFQLKGGGWFNQGYGGSSGGRGSGDSGDAGSSEGSGGSADGGTSSGKKKKKKTGSNGGSKGAAATA